MVFKKGHKPWNKNKKGIQIGWNKGTKGIMKSNSTSFKKGQTSWNKGMKGTYSLKHSGQFKKGNVPWSKGKKMSLEFRKKLSISMKGRKAWNKGKHPKYVQGSNNPAWKGGKRLCNGYFLIHKPKHPFSDSGNYVSEHRFIMEKHLKRYLKSTEVVHHINSIKTDNRIENLILFKNNTFHCWFHKKGFCNPVGIVFDGRKL